MLSWLIRHRFAVAIYFLEVWNSHLEAVYRWRMYNYIAWCTTVNLAFHDTFTAFCPHQCRHYSSLLSCFNFRKFLFDNACWLIAGWLFWILQLVQLSWCPNFCKVVLLSTLSTSFFPCWAIFWGHMFLLYPTVSTKCFLVSTSSEISFSLIVSFPVWIICLISLWLVIFFAYIF